MASTSSSVTPTPIMDKTLGTVANLAQLLPTGTVFAFEALSPSFTNRGTCYTTNRYLTAILIVLCTLSVCFFTITDSLKGSNKKLYYGIATFGGFYVLNYDNEEEERLDETKLRALRLRPRDYTLVFFSCLAFLALAVGDSDVQKCFTLGKEENSKELYRNLPLGIGFLVTLVFCIFPTSRKGIGHCEPKPNTSSQLMEP
ncbi:hypothetical protein ACHQM5_026899 [Ranunculus cassubicifolius]